MPNPILFIEGILFLFAIKTIQILTTTVEEEKTIQILTSTVEDRVNLLRFSCLFFFLINELP